MVNDFEMSNPWTHLSSMQESGTSRNVIIDTEQMRHYRLPAASESKRPIPCLNTDLLIKAER